MKRFKVTVDEQVFEVTVEEISTPQAPPNRPATESAPSAPPAAANSGEANAAGYTVTSPMAGSVINVHVKPGGAVAEGDVLLVLEAMKMENEITAPVSGTVTSVRIKAGDTVNSGDTLIVIA